MEDINQPMADAMADPTTTVVMPEPKPEPKKKAAPKKKSASKKKDD